MNDTQKDLYSQRGKTPFSIKMNKTQTNLYSQRGKTLSILQECISYIDLHFELIKDDYLRELDFTDINNLNEGVKYRLCKSLYDYNLQKQKEKLNKLTNLCREMNKYLDYKRLYGPLPVDIKEHIASNVEFFIRNFLSIG